MTTFYALIEGSHVAYTGAPPWVPPPSEFGVVIALIRVPTDDHASLAGLGRDTHVAVVAWDVKGGSQLGIYPESHLRHQTEAERAEALSAGGRVSH